MSNLSNQPDIAPEKLGLPEESKAPNSVRPSSRRSSAERKAPEKHRKHRKHRTFSAAFKSEVVLELLTGKKTQAQLCQEHELSPYLLQQWKGIFLAHASAAFQRPEEQDAEEVARAAERERLLGQLTVENEILKKVSQRLSAKKEGGES